MSSHTLDPVASDMDLKKSRRKKATLADPSRVDRLPPHSTESEQGVLGCVLLSPNDCMGISLERFKNTEDVFYDLRHQAIFDLMKEMYDKREAIDIITLHQRLKDNHQIEAVGGFAYLASLPEAVPSAANLVNYLDIVHEKYLLRQMIQACTGAIGRIYEHEGEVDALLDEVECDILKVNEQRVVNTTPDIKTLIHGSINHFEACLTNKGALTGIGTGFADFDRITQGLQNSQMIVIAARPSVGKTSLAMNIVECVAVSQKIPVGVFSLEMTAQSLVNRMLAARARVNLKSVSEGFLTERDFPKLTMASGQIMGAPLYIDDTPGLSILQLRAKARRMWQQHGIKLFVIDYLQLLHSTSRKAQNNRQQEVSEISSGIKALSKELGVPVLVLAQLNRELEKGKERVPRLSDLRESGAIEQDSDLVGLLYKEKIGDDEGDAGADYDGMPVNLLIAKHRDGPTGSVPLTFLKAYTRFESSAKVSDADVP